MFGTAGLVRDRREMQKRERQREQQQQLRYANDALPNVAAHPPMMATSSTASPAVETSPTLKTIKFGSFSIRY